MWAKIGLLSFGGPAGQIALMHREVIEKHALISEREFLSALNFCMLLPGPEAMQLATYIGWKLHGWRGGLTAGLLFVLPGALVLYGLSWLYLLYGNVPLVTNLFWGVKAAVLAIVLEALLRVAKRALKLRVDYVVAALAFIALFCFGLPFPLVILAAALFGFFTAQSNTLQDARSVPKAFTTVKTATLWLAIWLIPLVVLHVAWPESVFAALGDFFSKLSVVTFGGAYAVLSYMGQDVVEAHHWLTAPEMMDGLGLAETTPGPLILVGQFVGFLAAAKAQGNAAAGFAGGAVYLWMTFVPCFMWIFVGAPYIEWLQGNARLSSALAKVTAAVTGVILNLSIWFGLHVLFGKVERLSGPVPIWWPDFGGVDLAAFALSCFAGFTLLRFHWGMVKTLAFCSGLGIIWKMLVPMM
jgi:chromate transporter